MEGLRGHYAQLLEHHLALLQLRFQQVPHAQQAMFAHILMAALLLRLPSLFWVWLSLMRSLLSMCPYAACIASVGYLFRLMSRPWLRQEWIDYLQQWRGPKDVQCVICFEMLPGSAWNFANLSCCGHSLCWSCVRRHAESVIDDARPEMLCPLLPCRRVLPDVAVYSSFRREQWTWRWSWPFLDVFGSRERRKRRTYDRWVLSCGLAASCRARVEDVIHCPRDGCGYMWVLPQEQRQRKRDLEPRSRWNPKAWSLGRHMGLYHAPTQDGRDIRKVTCARCEEDFCILCSMSWRARDGVVHDGKACLEYEAALPKRPRDHGKWAGAKACPGCNVRIQREMGCNHMTCTQCGAEWCWVCRARWQPSHYSCVQLQDDCLLL